MSYNWSTSWPVFNFTNVLDFCVNLEVCSLNNQMWSKIRQSLKLILIPTRLNDWLVLRLQRDPQKRPTQKSRETMFPNSSQKEAAGITLGLFFLWSTLQHYYCYCYYNYSCWYAMQMLCKLQVFERQLGQSRLPLSVCMEDDVECLPHSCQNKEI